MNNELPWIAEGRKHIGLLENTSKTQHHPQIIRWLEQMGSFNGEAKAWWRDDEQPWCGLYVAICLGLSGRFIVKEWYRAREWESDKMTKILRPAYGCIVTFTRNGGGHVGFVVGQDQSNNLMVLGGNQSNRVSIAPFAKNRVTGYYWPSTWTSGAVVKSSPLTSRYVLPVLKSDGRVSTNEA